MSSSVEALFKQSVPLSVKVLFLDASLNGHTFWPEGEHFQALINKITDLIVPSNTRCEGLLLLETSLQQCPIIQAGSQWISILISSIKSQDSEICKELACKCIILIIENSNYESVRRNHAAHAVVSEILSSVEVHDGWLLYALKVFNVCMKKYGSVLSSLHTEISNFLYKSMNCIQPETIKILAECFAKLPTCCENRTGLYRRLWESQVSKFICTLEDILNFFSTFYEPDFIPNEVDKVKICALPLISNEPTPTIVEKAQLFQVLCKCLAEMFSVHTRGEVTVPIASLINLFCRVFQFPDDLCNPRSIEAQTLCTIFPVLQNSGLIVLEAMIKNFQLEMMLSSQYIMNLIEGIFRASKTNPVTKYTNSQIRYSIWKILDIWIAQNSVQSLLPLFEGAILEELRYEIAVRELPLESVVPAKDGKVPLDKYSAKNSVGQSTMDSCGAALLVLKDLLFVATPYLNPPILKNLLEDIFTIFTKMQSSKEFPFPYESVKNRKQLYKVLQSMVINESPHKSLALKCSVGIFNRGLKDPDLKVVRVCQHAIVHCKNILHPRKPILPLIAEKSPRSEEDNWGKTAWNPQYSWMQDNQLHQDISDVAQPIQVAATYHGSNEAELHNMPVVESYSSGSYFNRGENQINGESSVLQNFSDWKQTEREEPDREILGKKKYNKEITEKKFVEKKYIFTEHNTEDVQEMEVDPSALNEQSNTDELHIVENSQLGKGPNKNICQNGVLILSDEELPSSSLQKTGNGDLSLTSSEENSEEDVEEEGENEGDVEEEYDDGESMEDDSPTKKEQACSEDLESDDGNVSDNQTEEASKKNPPEPSSPPDDLPETPPLVDSEAEHSPSVKEMCASFVLCEAKDAS